MSTVKNEYSLRQLFWQAKSFLAYLKTKWFILLASLCIGGVCGFGIYMFQPPHYEGVTTFILEEKTGGGGLAGLASQFGFDLGSISGSGNNIFAGDNILDILKSKRIVYKVLLTKAGADSSSTLADRFLNFSGWQQKWKQQNNALAQLRFSALDKGENVSAQKDSLLNLIHTELLKKAVSADRKNKKASIVTVSVVTADPLFSRLFSERLVNEATRFYLDIKTQNAQNNIGQMQRKADSLLSLLNQKSYAVVNTQVLDINPGFRQAAVPTELATRDKMVLSTLYGEVTKNLEASKLLLAQQTPVLQILDRPDDIPRDKKTSAALLIAGFATGIFFFVVLILFGRFLLKTTM